VKHVVGPVLLVCSAALFLLWAQPRPRQKQIALPNSKQLRVPVPGGVGRLNSFPATIALSSEGHYAALLNNGFGTQESGARQSIAVLDLKTNQIADFPDDRFPQDAHQSYFLGLTFSGDGHHLYVSVGSITDPTGEKRGDLGNGIAVYSFRDGTIAPERFIKIPPQELAAEKKVAFGLRKTASGTAIPYPAGLALVQSGGSEQLLVANNLSDNAVLLDPRDGRILHAFDLSSGNLVPSTFPYTVVATRDGRRAWCSLWNASRIAELDLEKGAVARWISALEPKDPLIPGSHPTALLLSPDEGLLYVALSNADRVAVVATSSGQITRLLDTTVSGQKYAGTSPNALALSADGSRLFVADASINAVAVFDSSKFTPAPAQSMAEPVEVKARGFIPTEWYPSALAITANDLLIATAKGQGSGPNNGISQLKNEHRRRQHPYIPTLIGGSVARLSLHDVLGNLADFTRQVEQDNLFRPHSDPGNISFAKGANPIHHVIYIIKENRTYDQILGDLKAGDRKVGDGDPSLIMYGADITPNEHKLALQFGVLDNFYDSGEVSGDGHLWSTAAITTDYNEKTWQIGYRSKERIYDYQGTVSDEYMLDYRLPDIDDPSTGYLWDNVAHHGLSYRDYGEFVLAEWCRKKRKAVSFKAKSEEAVSPQEGTPSPFSAACAQTEIRKGDALPSNVGQPHGTPSPWPWPVPALKRMKPAKAVLRDHFDPLYPDFQLDFPDQLRADEFLNEFDGFVRARKTGKGTELPNFILLYLPNDHTIGTQPGMPRPAASVADNDIALGRIVEAVSHSPYWNDTAILVLEDDAQDGADHLDAHRSIAFVVSKYSPGSVEQPFVDHRFYTTVNMIHTVEALLGLPPMNQNDAYAPVMAPLFSGPGTQPPYTADYRNRDNNLIYQINPRKAPGGEESSLMDFSRPDAANAKRLNAILWRDCKGAIAIPPSRHAIIRVSSETKEPD
jgi:DNA-binding beta-propeller fold protein YncE